MLTLYLFSSSDEHHKLIPRHQNSNIMYQLTKLFSLLSFLSCYHSNAAYVRSRTSSFDKDGHVTIERPKGTDEGDLLFLFLSRTDDVLPVKLPGWKHAASCLKRKNAVDECLTIEECDDHIDGDMCYGGKDLGTVVFYRQIEREEPKSYSWNIEGFHRNPAWAILIAIREGNVNIDNPVRSIATVSCDKSVKGHFPSVFGKKRDVLLLSMAFDDRADIDDFKAPTGTKLEAYVEDKDEAGFLFSKKLSREGQTGVRVTRGNGRDPGRCKDALISLVVRRKK